ncbi:hypothetical protein AKO1_005463 [Acrasis kona]|uniref:Uncharacterized protein n=1 Tax=Acrasis kona TaxID=1008807 RepID=A0AAW2ZMC7_9EUKA
MNTGSVESKVCQWLILSFTSICTAYCSFRFIQHCTNSPSTTTKEDLDGELEEPNTLFSKRDTHNYYAPRQNIIQRIILLLCTLNVTLTGLSYGFVHVLPNPGWLHITDVRSKGFYEMFTKFWLPIIVSKLLLTLISGLIYATVASWLIRVCFTDYQQRYKISLSIENEQEEVGSHFKHLKQKIYIVCCFLNKHLPFLLYLFFFAIICIELILTLCFQSELLISQTRRVFLYTTLNNLTTLLWSIVALIFLFNLVYRTEHIRLPYVSFVIAKRGKPVLPIFIVVGFTYILLNALTAHHVRPFSCLRLVFPFQEPYNLNCLPIARSELQSKDTYNLSSETMLWFLFFICIPTFTITHCFRPVPPVQTESLHLIQVVRPDPESSEEINDDTPYSRNYRHRSLSALICYLPSFPKLRRYSLDRPKL